MLKNFSEYAFDIVIQAGQSNAEGCGLGPTDDPYAPSDRVWYLNGDFTITRAEESVQGNDTRTNFSLPFARSYCRDGRLAEGRNLLILRCAVGGTGFRDNHWKPEDDLFLRMMDMIRTALALNKENRLVAFLWHQGETDAILGAGYDEHYDHLSTLLRLVREEFAVPELPFIAGDFVHHWERANQAVCTPVVEAIRAVCRDSGACGFVETEGLLSNSQEEWEPHIDWEDPIHFSRRSTYELGERYYRAYVQIIEQ